MWNYYDDGRGAIRCINSRTLSEMRQRPRGQYRVGEEALRGLVVDGPRIFRPTIGVEYPGQLLRECETERLAELEARAILFPREPAEPEPCTES